MDKNTVIGLLIIFGILVGFSVLNRPSEAEMERLQRQRDSIAQVQAAEQARLAAEIRKDTTAMVADSTGRKQLQESLGVFAATATGDNRFVTLENELLKITFATRGGRPYSVELKKYKRYDKQPLVLFSGDSTVFGFNFFSHSRSIATDRLYFEPSVEDSVLRMTLRADDGAAIEYVYTLHPDNYMIDFDVRLTGLDRLLTGNQTMIDFSWQVYLRQQEKGFDNENMYSSLFYKSGDDVETFSSSKETEAQTINFPLDWIAFKQQFFMWTLVSKDRFANATLRSVKGTHQQRFIKHYEATVGMALDPPQQKPDQTMRMSMYFGPNHAITLEQYGLDMEKMIPLSNNLWLFRITGRWINGHIIIPLFNWLGGFISNYGIIILIMTIIIKLVLFPLTFKSLKSAAKMRVLKPQVDEIHKKMLKSKLDAIEKRFGSEHEKEKQEAVKQLYKTEKVMERQQAVMAFYRKAGVSPMGGCIPVLLQSPILVALFTLFPVAIELRQQSFLWASDLSTYDSVLHLPFSIPFYGDHVSLFTLLMAAATIFSMRISSGQTDNSAVPGMKMMMYLMPVMFMFFFNNYAAGLTYYYFLSSVITILQNEIVKRTIDEKKLLAKLNAKSDKPSKKSRFQNWMEQAQKKQQAQAREIAKSRKR